MKSKIKGVPLAVIGLCAGLWSITTAEAGQSARPAAGASYAPPDRAELPPAERNAIDEIARYIAAKMH
jgi:hypothetical protein